MSAALNLRRSRAHAIARRRQREMEYTRILAACIGNAAREAVTAHHDVVLKEPEMRH